MTVLFIAKGKMYRIDSGKTSEIQSDVLKSYTEKIYANAKRNEWKTQGKGAVFTEQFEPGGDADTKVNSIRSFASAVACEGTSVIYSQTIDDFSGLFIKKEDSAEGIIYSGTSELIREFDKIDNRIVASIGYSYTNESHIGVIEAGKSDYRMLTEGDSEDRYPVFSRFEENVIYYSSSGLEINDDENKEADEESDHGVNALFTSGIRIKRRRGPAALCKLDVSAIQAEELLSDGKYDYIKPSTDEKGNIYFIRKPYEEDGGSTSVLGCLTDILFFPVRLVGGIIGFFNFLSVIFSGKNLRKSRDNAPAKTRKKSDGRIYIEGHAINAAKELKKNSSGSEKYPGIIPSSYELCKLYDGQISVIKKGVIAYAIDKDDVIISNGSALLRISGDGKQTKLSDICCITFVKIEQES